jgi:hypothetical protein
MHPRRAVAAVEAVSSGGTALGTTLSASAQLRVSSGSVAIVPLKWEPKANQGRNSAEQTRAIGVTSESV